MSAHIRTQTAWNETYEQIEQRRKLAQSEDTGWMGTIVGLSIAVATLVALTLLH